METDLDGRIEREHALHSRLLDGDPVATVDLFEYASPHLLRGLRSKYPSTDDDLIGQAISETLLEYFDRPERFDPEKRSLRGYLFMAADRDLINLLQREKRRPAGSTAADPVELDHHARNAWSRGADFTLDLEREESVAALRERALAVARTEEERLVQELRLEGESATPVYAAALGWEDLPAKEQRDRLYKIKDRLNHRLRREMRHE